ncbi:hypothetical protein EI94DRAFT_1732702 [Lactarius quietus]|nr:hypothetical protein EI94DRAFT_1732702 [Lactarius quietus]
MAAPQIASAAPYPRKFWLEKVPIQLPPTERCGHTIWSVPCATRLIQLLYSDVRSLANTDKGSHTPVLR